MCDPTGRTWWTRARKRIEARSLCPDNDSKESEGLSEVRMSSGRARAVSDESGLTDALLRHIQGKLAVVLLEWVLMKPIMVRRRGAV
jgi:hypothetical protein